MAGGHIWVWGDYGISTYNIMLGQYVSQKLHAMIIILLIVLLHCIIYAFI